MSFGPIPDGYITVAELAKRWETTIATIHRWSRSDPPTMPARVFLPGRPKVWKLQDIEAWETTGQLTDE